MKNLERIRKAKGMSLEELAAASKTKYATIYAWEKGIRKAGAEKARPVARALGVSIEELLGDDESTVEGKT